MSQADDLQEVRELFPTAQAERTYGGHWQYVVPVPGDSLLITSAGPKHQRWRCDLRGFVFGCGSSAQAAYLALWERFKEDVRTRREVENLQLAWLSKHGEKFK